MDPRGRSRRSRFRGGLASGLDATFWFNRHLGLDLRVLVSGLARLAGTSASRNQDRTELLGGVGLELDLGIAF